MQLYPRFMFHKEQAPEGRLFQSAEEAEALGPDWVVTPAAFDPNYVAPAELVPSGSIPIEAANAGFIPQAYPAWRHQKNGEPCLVQNAEEDDALDPDVWKASPADHGIAAADVAPVIPFPSAPAPSGSVLGDATEAEQKAAQEMAAKATELHNTSIADITKVLEGCPDVSVLRNVKQLEMLNPAGPRITLVRFIDNAVKAIEVPAAPSDAPPATPAS